MIISALNYLENSFKEIFGGRVLTLTTPIQ